MGTDTGIAATQQDTSMEKIAETLGGFLSKEQIAVIHNSVAKGTTMTELAYFLNVAKSVKLNPFNKEIWCYKDKKDNLVIFTGRDGFLSKAQDNPNFNGIRSAEVKKNDEFEIDIANNSVKHTIKDLANRGDIVGAYAIVFRKDGEPTLVTVEFSRYKKDFYGPWKTHPEDMIKKVAESKALKLAFGISGLQIEDEFDIKNGVAIPHEVIEAKRTLSDREFKQFLGQSTDYIEKYQDKFEFTEEQQKQVSNRLSQTA